MAHSLTILEPRDQPAAIVWVDSAQVLHLYGDTGAVTLQTVAVGDAALTDYAREYPEAFAGVAAKPLLLALDGSELIFVGYLDAVRSVDWGVGEPPLMADDFDTITNEPGDPPTDPIYTDLSDDPPDEPPADETQGASLKLSGKKEKSGGLYTSHGGIHVDHGHHRVKHHRHHGKHGH